MNDGAFVVFSSSLQDLAMYAESMHNDMCW